MALGSSTTPTAESIVPCPNHDLRNGWDNEAVRTPLPCLRYGDGMADAAEGVVAAVAAAGGDDEVVFAAGDWVVKDDFGGDGVAFGALRQGVEGLGEVGERGEKLV